MTFFSSIFKRRGSATEKPQPLGVETKEHYQQWWRHAANGESLFRVEEDNVLRGSLFEEPYFHVRLIEDGDGEGQTFRDVARQLYYNGVGAILCRDGWAVEQKDNLDCLFLSFGDVVGFLMQGELIERHGSPIGWDSTLDKAKMRISEPDFETLFPHQRVVILQAMESLGVEKPKVGLVTDHKGKKGLVFNLHEYLPDEKAVARVSALIDWFLPRYYYQLVVKEDWNAAIYPVLPLSSGVQESLHGTSEPRDVLDEIYRSMRRMRAAHDADSVPTQGERIWRNIAASPESRFLLNVEERVDRPNGEHYLVLRLDPSGKHANATFRQAALVAADLHCGILLCHVWPIPPGLGNKETEITAFSLRLGDVVDFLMTGNLERRRFASDGWAMASEHFGGILTEPDVRLLPLPSRMGILSAMNEFGVTDQTLSLQTLNDGRRLLFFGGHYTVGHDPDLVNALSERIQWCLPRHYSALLVDSQEYVPWPVFPSGTAPSTDVIDLNGGGAEDEDEQEVVE